MQVVGRVLGARERPLVLGSPLPAVPQTALGGAPAIAAAHDEDAHRRLVFDAIVNIFEPAIEPAFLLRVEAREAPQRLWAEVHLGDPGTPVATHALVVPGAHDQLLG